MADLEDGLDHYQTIVSLKQMIVFKVLAAVVDLQMNHYSLHVLLIGKDWLVLKSISLFPLHH